MSRTLYDPHNGLRLRWGHFGRGYSNYETGRNPTGVVHHPLITEWAEPYGPENWKPSRSAEDAWLTDRLLSIAAKLYRQAEGISQSNVWTYWNDLTDEAREQWIQQALPIAAKRFRRGRKAGKPMAQHITDTYQRQLVASLNPPNRED